VSDLAQDQADGTALPEHEAPPPASPYDLPGSWYVIHSYSGYENKVKVNLETRIRSMHREDAIFDVVIPMEEVVEIKSGRKVTVPASSSRATCWSACSWTTIPGRWFATPRG